MDDVLYTISNRYVKASDLSKELEDLTTIKLPYESDIYGRYDVGVTDIDIAME
jgi:hypothetical protein